MEQIATYQTLVLGLIVMSTATEAHLNALFGPLVEWRDFVAPVAVHLILMWTRLFVIAVGLMGLWARPFYRSSRRWAHM
jgi:hypothetical protein